MRDSVRLADCLVQPPALGFRTHLRRWKWLLASLILQAALVSIGLLVPLLAENSTPALRTSRAFLFSASERRGSALAGDSSQAQSAAPAGRRKPHLLSVLRQPPVIPSRIQQLADVPAGEAPVEVETRVIVNFQLQREAVYGDGSWLVQRRRRTRAPAFPLV